jgi:hypothetical protein
MSERASRSTSAGGPGIQPSLHDLDYPELLFHYTSIRGVEGIVLSRSVWASYLHYMNDSREWVYALDIVRGVLHSFVPQRKDGGWLAFIAELSQALDRIRHLNVCVFSLSAAANQLSQWRAYCPPDGGYAIAFSTKQLVEHLTRHGFALKQCIYDSTQQRQIINAIVEPIVRSVGPLDSEAQIESSREETLRRLAEELSLVAPVIKHPDFGEEREWRLFALVASTDPRMGYQVRGSIIVPRCVIDLETKTCGFPVLQISVGPNPNQELAMRGLHALKGKFAVTRSDTPLRNL